MAHFHRAWLADLLVEVVKKMLPGGGAQLDIPSLYKCEIS
jgi:hypothetical protein